jgi:hypothetical protein
MNVPDKAIIDAAGSRLQDALGCADLDIDTKELIVATFQFGLLMEPGLLQQFKEGNGLLESDYFDDPEYPREVKGKHWRMVIRKGKASKV